ncbi:hypothetical protein GCM10020254_43850 [Streptomyces goshikiensis]
MQPGGDGGFAAEGVGGPVGGDEGVLDGVGGFLAVSEGAQGDGPQPVPVTAYELTEGVGVSGGVQRQEFLVAAAAGLGVVQR